LWSAIVEIFNWILWWFLLRHASFLQVALSDSNLIHFGFNLGFRYGMQFMNCIFSVKLDGTQKCNSSNISWNTGGYRILSCLPLAEIVWSCCIFRQIWVPGFIISLKFAFVLCIVCNSSWETENHYVVNNKCFTLVWNTAAGKKWEASSVIRPIIHCTCFHGHIVDVSELIMCETEWNVEGPFLGKSVFNSYIQHNMRTKYFKYKYRVVYEQIMMNFIA